MKVSRKRAVVLAAVLVLAVAGYLLFRFFGPLRIPPAARAQLGAVADCAATVRSARMGCYQQALKDKVDHDGVAAAMAALKALSDVDPDVYRDGHVYAHGIGIEAYLHYRSVPATFDHCPVEFSSGCGHGVIQAFLESQSAVDSGTINTLCAPYRGAEKSRWQLFQCVHGMGHGLTMMYAGDLPHALQSCDLLAGDWDKDSCYGGAFMENIMSVIAPHHPATELAESHEHDHMQMAGGASAFKKLDPGQPLYPCSIMADKYLRACYDIQTSAILYYAKGSLSRTFAACDAAPPAWQGGCYKSIGRDITSRARQNASRTKRLCDQGSDKLRPWCYFGAVKALIDWRASPADGMAFCRLIGEKPSATFCYQGVGEQVGALVVSEAEREKLCASAAGADGIAACRYGAQLPNAVLPKTGS